MKKESKTKYAILGILGIKPMSGYDIRKTMAKSTQYFWQESNGQLYPTLAKLTQDKDITSENVLNGDKSKIIYEITKAGREKLSLWLHKEIDYYPERKELLLKIFFGKNVEHKVIIQHINNHLEYCQSNLKLYQTIAKDTGKLMATKKHAVYYLLTVNSGIKLMQAEISWCHDSIKLIENQFN